MIKNAIIVCFSRKLALPDLHQVNLVKAALCWRCNLQGAASMTLFRQWLQSSCFVFLNSFSLKWVESVYWRWESTDGYKYIDRAFKLGQIEVYGYLIIPETNQKKKNNALKLGKERSGGERSISSANQIEEEKKTFSFSNKLNVISHIRRGKNGERKRGHTGSFQHTSF